MPDPRWSDQELVELAQMAKRGFTFYACVGPWARPHLMRPPAAFGVCLGWFSVAILSWDIEVWAEISTEYMKRAHEAKKGS